ncbi:MAG: hypothetical protein HC915_19865 [Anaerolineae bacterium]|nr:hypothetical protein [Anaerolineae bacterium]
MGLGWALVVAPYVAWNYDISGEVLPSTADAKVAQNAPRRELPLGERALEMLLPLSAGAQLMGLPGVIFGVALIVQRARHDRRTWLFLLPLAWAVAHWLLFTLRLPAPFQHGRYVMPMLPPVLLYLSGGLLGLVEAGRRSVAGRVLSRTLALGTFLLFPGFWWIGGQAYAQDVRLINTEMVATARWVERNVPPDDLFAVHDIGALGYFANREILDLAGLVSPEVVPLFPNPPAIMQLVCESGAGWMMVLPDQRETSGASATDPRLELAYESPYDDMAQARGRTTEPWKMRVYRVRCGPDSLDQD